MVRKEKAGRSKPAPLPHWLSYPSRGVAGVEELPEREQRIPPGHAQSVLFFWSDPNSDP